jgi:Cd2+/Zn2+-exporting ATPase
LDASVNFGASKLTVFGDTTIDEIEKAGAFENIRVIPEHQKFAETKEPFFQKYKGLLVSFLLLMIGWLLGHLYGEQSIFAVIGYGASIIVGGYRLFKEGLKNLLRLQFEMRTLMTIAVIGASFIGQWGEAATVVILFAISEVLEAYSMDKARQSIRNLVDIAPKDALIRRGNQELTVDVAEIQIGDILIVKPGQKIAMDGMVVKGESTVNQAPITGESIPVSKTVDDHVFAGTLNEEGLLEVKVTKHVEDTMIAKIIHLVEEAQGERAPSQAFVDRFAKYYTPIIIVISFLVALIPPLFFDASWSKWVYQGLAVLVVGCPCALVISTPVSIVTAIGNAARNGVLIKGGIHLEEMGAIQAIAFDKTGTLTHGIPVVTDYWPQGGFGSDELLTIVAALENKSQHPLSSAIVKKAEQANLDYQSLLVEEFTAIIGKGIKGKINGRIVFVGSPALFEEILTGGISNDTRDEISKLQNFGKTVMVAGNSDGIIGILAVADEVRGNAKSVIQKLHSLGIKKTVMLTGDNYGTAAAIGKQAGVAEIEAELLPQDKLTSIKKLKAKYNHVAMVGDGVNDAPALATANVGIAMGGAGTDTALETADLALMADDLAKLPFTLKLSRKALNIIKQNITFSLGIKLLALLLVVPGWLTLWIAIFADMGATLIVTLNGLRLLRVQDE